MRPPSLDLKDCRVKKVFTNLNNDDLAVASSSGRSHLELEFGGLSPARISMFNLEEPLPSPILERPLRIRRRIRNFLSDTSGNTPVTPDSALLGSNNRSSFSVPPLIMNPDGTVKSPHRKPSLIIKSHIKRVCPPEIAWKQLYDLLSERKRSLYIIIEDPEGE